MRILLAVPPSSARLFNLVPLGWALRTAGHEVQIAGRAAFTGTITTTGFVAVPAGGDGQSDVDELVAYASLWGPDLVVWDADAPTAAEVAGAVGAASVRVLGPHDPDTGDRDSDDDDLDLLPPSLRAGGRPLRFVPYAGPSVVPPWLRRKPRRRRVFVSAGVPGEAIAGLFDAVSGMDVELVCSLPEDRIPAGTRLPSNVRIFESAPVHAVLGTCSAIVHDGDPALATAALAKGLPQLAVGHSTWLAARIAETGAGLLADPATVDKTVLDLLVNDQPHRDRAAAVGAEIAAMPSPREVVPELVRVARGR